MRRNFHLGIALAVAGCLFVLCAHAQSWDEVSLGDLARSLRKEKQPAAPVVIDNDNLSQVMDQVESHRLSGSLLFSVDGPKNRFKMSSPDGTCSLSFSANATSLLSVPPMAEVLPQSELAKLEGPASIDGDALQISVFNGTDWDLREITVGLTIVRHLENTTAFLGSARLVPAADTDDSEPAGKPSDQTILLHMKAAAAPLLMTVFREKLNTIITPDQEWHWSIIDAKGIPPSTLATVPAF
ncbi:MAG: hypothetical protein WB952_03915 [Terriglobales bacterium]